MECESRLGVHDFVIQYKRNFKEKNTVMHYKEFYKNNEEESRILENMLACLIKRSFYMTRPPEYYDKRLVILAEREYIEPIILKSICPSAYELIFDVYNEHIVDELVVKGFLNSGKNSLISNNFILLCLILINMKVNSTTIEMNSAGVGKCLESTLILLILKKKLTKMKVISISGIGNDKRTTKTIEFSSDFNYYHFLGHLAPDNLSPSVKEVTLYIPLSDSYPGYDFIYKTANIVYFFQVTIRENAYSHVSENDDSFGVKKTVQVSK